MHDIFISYSHCNKEIADALCHYLENIGIRCWYAPRDIGPGNWAASIVQAIKKSKIFILVYSKDSNTSDQVLNEISIASSSGCIIMPFKIDNSDMNDDFMYYLKAVHWFDAITPPMIKNIENFCQKVKVILDSINQSIIEKKTDTEKPDNQNLSKKKKKEKSKKKSRLILCGIVAFLVFIIIVITDISKHTTPTLSENDYQTISYTYLSEAKEYRYPFYSTSGCSTEGNMIFLENQEDSSLHLYKVSPGLRVIDGIEYPYTEKHYSDDGSINFSLIYVMASETSDIVYFIDNADGTIKIFDRSAEAWINKSGIKMNLKETEFTSLNVYSNGGLTTERSQSDCIAALVYDSATDMNCYSKILYIDPSKSECLTHNISKYRIKDILLTYDNSDNSIQDNTIVMYDENNLLHLVDVKNGTVKKITNKELFENYLPYVSATQTNVKVSSDGKYVAIYLPTKNGADVIVWNVENNKTVFSATYVRGFTIGFLPDNKFFVFNKENHTLTSYDLENNNKSTTLLSEDYFTDSEIFIDKPFALTYSDKLELFFFSSGIYNEETDSYTNQLVVCDTSGNIVAKDKKIKVTYDSYYADVLVNDDKFLYIIADAGEEEEKEKNDTNTDDNNVITELYCCLYSYDKDGKIIFS